jgi:hypothetical protein
MAFLIRDRRGNEKKTESGESVLGSIIGCTIKEAKTDESTGERSFRAVASSENLDRDGDVIIQSGFEWTIGPEGKPLVSGPWAHDYWEVPIYRVEDLGVVNNQLSFTPVFPPKGVDEFVDKVWQAYMDRRMFGFSVGFVPMEVERLTRGMLAEMRGEEVEDAEKDDYLGRLYKRSKLIEISAAPVPANPDAAAILRGFGSGPDVDRLDRDTVVPKGLFSVEESDGGMVSVFNVSATAEAEAKSVVPYKKYVLDSDSPWRAAAAKGRVARWAGIDADDAGAPAWRKYSSAFTIWPGSGSDMTREGFKLPHHDIKDGDMITVKRGVVAAAAVLQGARGGVDSNDADISGARSHIGRHYKEWDGVPPWESDDGKQIDELLIRAMSGELVTGEAEKLAEAIDHSYGDVWDDVCQEGLSVDDIKALAKSPTGSPLAMGGFVDLPEDAPEFAKAINHNQEMFGHQLAHLMRVMGVDSIDLSEQATGQQSPTPPDTVVDLGLLLREVAVDEGMSSQEGDGPVAVIDMKAILEGAEADQPPPAGDGDGDGFAKPVLVPIT